ncbi:hypothetical protein GF354_00435 [Candidatus Peregrinibacteria bacterium]|nr:hypothetical protein [Candidatus Peregrinibacteria bacterium]
MKIFIISGDLSWMKRFILNFKLRLDFDKVISVYREFLDIHVEAEGIRERYMLSKISSQLEKLSRIARFKGKEAKVLITLGNAHLSVITNLQELG